MTRTAEIRSRLTDDSELNGWIAEMLSRLPLEESPIEFPEHRFADTVKIPRARIKAAASEPWFDRSPVKVVDEPITSAACQFAVHYEPRNAKSLRRQWRRHLANRILAVWWRCTGRGTASVVWAID
jgi:hypothetical protein